MGSVIWECKGPPCDKAAACEEEGCCLYRSSADVAREVRAKEIRETAEKKMPRVEDFKGAIDGKGIKTVMFDAKCSLQLITPEILEGLGNVLLHGAKKYAPNNWMRGMSWETVMGGVLRHLTAFRRGEEMDPDSGLPHLHHAACGVMFLSWYANGPDREKHAAFDDRQYKVDDEC